ncbi:hypothetical protein [Chthonomonas calidirosea]|uniref:hypothetical protein n=1 Tax=Chthonomonas calidirosea TaxID=454171 RepID=UPI0003AA95F4|nr:hypothetical protein [Chthonomonas calidirosea]
MGDANERYTQILSGIQSGEQVIYEGYRSLHEGDPVVPVPWGPAGPVALPTAAQVNRALNTPMGTSARTMPGMSMPSQGGGRP